jgi:hypothetical protein
MAQIKLKPGWVHRIINGEYTGPEELAYCVVCGTWGIKSVHDFKYHTEPVEPGVKENKIAGPHTY